MLWQTCYRNNQPPVTSTQRSPTFLRSRGIMVGMPNGHFQGHKQIEKKQYNGLFKGQNILKRSNKTAFLKAKTYLKEAKKTGPFKGHINSRKEAISCEQLSTFIRSSLMSGPGRFSNPENSLIRKFPAGTNVSGLTNHHCMPKAYPHRGWGYNL